MNSASSGLCAAAVTAAWKRWSSATQLPAPDGAYHGLECGVDLLQVLVRAAFGREGCEFGLQGVPGVQDIGESTAAFHHGLKWFGVEAVAEQEGAAAVPHFDEALHFQGHDGLPHRGPAHREAFRQVAFRGQPVARLEAFRLDVFAEALDDLLVQTRPGNRTQRLGQRTTRPFPQHSYCCRPLTADQTLPTL